MDSFSSLFKSSVVTTDGGFGTTLEQVFHLDISHTPLWSAKAVVEEPDVIVQAHLAFLRAGAQIILTSTYQCSYHTFERAGYTVAEAKEITLKSVDLARRAREIFNEEQLQQGQSIPNVRIALSLGPFGASLSPAHEFDGYYPPPYGPRMFSFDDDNCNAYPEGNHGDSEILRSIQVLAEFHFDRLMIMLDDDKAWSSIDCLAFETVPLVREIKAIRKTMGWLMERIAKGGKETKPWWISMVFPDGVFPETARDGKSRLTISDVVSAAVETNEDEGDSTSIPSGIGINCTSIEFVPELVIGMERAIITLLGGNDHDRERPWLIVYPNGGDVYDPITQTWKGNGDQEEEKIKWAEKLGRLEINSELWGGLVIGGCCRTGPGHVELLAKSIRT